MKFKFKGIAFGVLLLNLLLSLLPLTGQKKQVNIGVIVDGPWERNQGVRQLFQEEIRELLSGEFEVRFPEDKFLVADWTKPKIEAALDRLLTDPSVPEDVEAIYIAPLTRLLPGEFSRLVTELNNRRLPTFSLLGRPEVERGVLAALNPDIFPRIARRVALNLQRILLGEEPGKIPYAFAPGEELVINMATANQIEVYPPWGVYTEAVKINEEKDDAWANFSIQKSFQKSLEQERESLRLDIATEIATAYLQVLITKTLERIQEENLKLSHSNLELSRVREAVGYSGPADVYRWESQIAANRQQVINANAQRNVIEIELNRLLDHPLEESFETQEVSIEETGILTEQGRLFKYMVNRLAFKTLRNFFVEEGIAASPEIQQLEAAIAAQDRFLKNTNRNFFIPDLVAQAEYSYIFKEGGVGSDVTDNVDPTDPSGSLVAGIRNKENWSVALNLSYPLFSGGAKFARRKNALETLSQLRTERQSLVQRIEQRVRSSAHTTGASYAAIKQSKDAGEIESSGKANESIGAKLPVAALVIILLLVAQFDSIRRPAIILLTIPLGLIGVFVGLFITQEPLGFMAFLGVIALAGIVINNAIVLIDRIKIEIEENGLEPQRAVVESAQRRLRPILLTTATTIGGLVPLWLGGGAMFSAMAVAILFGLMFATVLTLGFVPIMYTLFFRVKFKEFKY